MFIYRLCGNTFRYGVNIKHVFKHWVNMSSKRRGIVKESWVELSVPEWGSEGGDLWFIEVLTHLKTRLRFEEFILIYSITFKTLSWNGNIAGRIPNWVLNAFIFSQKTLRKREVLLSRISVYIVGMMVSCHTIRIVPNTWEIIQTFNAENPQVRNYMKIQGN